MTNRPTSTVRNPASPVDGRIERTHTMTTKRTRRATATATATVPATVDTIAADVTATVDPIAEPIAEPTAPPAYDPAAALLAAMVAVGVTPAAGFVVPPFIVAAAHAFRAIAGRTIRDRADMVAMRDAFVTAMESAFPGTPAADKCATNSGRFSGHHVFESQNALYVAAAVSGVVVSDLMFAAAWRAELPNAKCDYLTRTTYPRTTMSEYINGKHNACPGVDGAVDIVRTWRNRDRKPIAG
jgi:hypothetical protein